MIQINNWFFDEIGCLMNDVVGVVQGVKCEFDIVIKVQVEKFLCDMDLVKCEEFEVVKDMVCLVCEENEVFKVCFVVFEVKLGG